MHLYWNFMGMSNKKSFTLIELVIGIGLLGIGLIAVFVVLNSWFKTVSQARWQVIAINLAREGMEMMFNIRDTNLIRRAGKKDECRLNTNTISPPTPIDQCENGVWLSKYPVWSPIKVTPHSWGAIVAETPGFFWANPLDIFGWSYFNPRFSMCLNTVTQKFEQCVINPNDTTLCYTRQPWWWDLPCAWLNLTPNTSFGRFYRMISSQWMYDKDPSVTWGNLIVCDNWADTYWWWIPCWWPQAKEFRFCSEVQYIIDEAKRKVTLCSLITNFDE